MWGDSQNRGNLKQTMFFSFYGLTQHFRPETSVLTLVVNVVYRRAGKSLIFVSLGFSFFFSSRI